MKWLVPLVTLLATYLSAILLVASVFVWQPDGMFWYGILTIVFGVLLKLEMDYWF